MNLLGISAFYHDSAAALVRDGHIIACAQEERFSRIKHDATMPREAIRYCLREARCTLDDIDIVVFYDKPLLKFARLITTFAAVSPRGFQPFRRAVPPWIGGKLLLRRYLLRALRELGATGRMESKLLFVEHHVSHAASAYFPSPFQSAAVLTMDGVGEWATTSMGVGHGHKLEIHKEIHFPHSLGLLYSAFTAYAGFRVNSGEYKLMGLAPYGVPRYAQTILDNILDVKADGSFRMNMEYFDYLTGLTMTSVRFDELFGGPPRKPEEPITQRHMDMAASIQEVLDQVVMKLASGVARETGASQLCMAGGVALNCVTNGKLRRMGRFASVWIQPAAGDAGAALGAALAAYYRLDGVARIPDGQTDGMRGGFLGPSYGEHEVMAALVEHDARFEKMEEGELIDRVAEDLSMGLTIGWHQGRMEFGPRALGGRSILADPRSPAMQDVLNESVKQRESFRPFAPAVLFEHLADWFDTDVPSPYMLFTEQVHEMRRVKESEGQGRLGGLDRLQEQRASIPAVTHVDSSSRVQTVHDATNPRFAKLLRSFYAKTGCPVLVNTSFNVRGEPMVCTPTDAFQCFMRTNLDVLAIGDFYLRKRDQVVSASRYTVSFPPD